MNELDWYEPKKNTNLVEQCPCCDYFTLSQRASYLICPICFWEDDGVDVNAQDNYSGPNHMSLRQGRQNFIQIGACDPKMLEHVLSEEDRKSFHYKAREK
ncbi:CPCC family cysteine-rich protein [Aliiglaciecola sp. LCG003]|uniref:CPCC family cysteine-rich protein n=1 Tax=Aliiglaciecola sp. LCG003 TaxID=3053655 RepID=UPI0025735427|nr:CPCC family cysteine-rich protein [Aliiglaciecola sp. LCG003]WJG09347.1 CPCC family cysteine-rich protein [Aliiglaciecola sp. LCG003]